MTAWKNPVPFRLVESADSLSFRDMGADETALPLAPHPGAFGVVRKNHVHEGVDLYCPDGTPVFAVEDGTVVDIQPFTGPKAGSGWWHDTDAVFVEGVSGVVVYGEITPSCEKGATVRAGGLIGHVKTVLREDKGRPMSMLHLELHSHGTRAAPEWPTEAEKPATLQDPTPFLKGVE